MPATRATRGHVSRPVTARTDTGQVLGAIIGGNVGSVVAQGSQLGLGAAFLRFSREYERQADIEGAQVMARAGYDPRDMANMFKTIQAEGSSGMPEWLSDHPHPGNRSEYILREAQALRVENPIRESRTFQQAQAHLRTLRPAPTTAELRRNNRSQPVGTSGTAGTLGGVEPSSTRFVTYKAGNLFQVSVPANWQRLPGSQSVTFAPRGGYATSGRQSVFTHGVEAGEAPAGSQDVRSATESLLTSLAHSNRSLSRASEYRSVNVGDARGLRVDLANVSDATGEQEHIALYTTLLPDGHLFYAVAVAPTRDFTTYEPSFARVVNSFRLANHRSTVR